MKNLNNDAVKSTEWNMNSTILANSVIQVLFQCETTSCFVLVGFKIWSILQCFTKKLMVTS